MVSEMILMWGQVYNGHWTSSNGKSAHGLCPRELKKGGNFLSTTLLASKILLYKEMPKLKSYLRSHLHVQ